VVTYPSLKGILENPDKRAQIVHSWAELDLFPGRPEGKKGEVYRIKTLRGFDGPPNEQIHREIRGALPFFLSHPTFEKDFKPDIVVIEDQGNGYRDNDECLRLLEKVLAHARVVIYKATKSLPTPQDRFFKLIQKYKDRVIVVISADSLREMGVKISQGLSWEKTGEDLSRAVRHNAVLKQLSECRHLIVRLCLSGAYHYAAPQSTERLYYDPRQIEKSFANDQHLGAMTGHNSVIVAAIVHQVIENNHELFDSAAPLPLTLKEIASVGEGLRCGVAACREYYLAGLGRTREELHNLGKPKLPNERIFGAKHDWVADTVLVRDRKGEPDFQQFGFLLDAFKGQDEAGVFQFAEQIVTRGISRALDGRSAKLPKFPVVQFGDKLTVVDRQEIEGYRAISSLIRDYSDKKIPPRPLSIAVFGAPGAGKSFGVKKIAESVLSDNRVVFVEQNLSQFTSPDELADVFHKVRDITLDASKLPVVFFDEFDAALGGNELGWLKFFLAPMQDGRFKYKQSTLGIGKSIFVFAGGTATKYLEFAAAMEGRTGGTDEAKKKYESFKELKGPDFVSRLRGHVNIIGINELNSRPDNTSRPGSDPGREPDPLIDDSSRDFLYLIRRAVLLRSFLEKLGPDLFDDKKTARIDRGVIHAFLKTREYLHGPRSMEAILEMSALSRKEVFDKSSLPKEELLDMHVHHPDFVKLLSEQPPV
jgi:ATPase family associated with various cellular activities (AAA)